MKKIPPLLIAIFIPNLFLFFLMGNQTEATNLSLNHVLAFAIILSIASLVLFCIAVTVSRNVYSSSIITTVSWSLFWLFSFVESAFVFIFLFVFIATIVIKTKIISRLRTKMLNSKHEKEKVTNENLAFQLKVIQIMLAGLITFVAFEKFFLDSIIVRSILNRMETYSSLVFLGLLMISCILSSLLVGKNFERRLREKSDIFKYASIILFILVGYNLFLSVNYLRTQQTGNFEFKTTFNAENNMPNPNIYWLHLDGMWSLNNVEDVFHESQDFFRNKLAERGFLINEDARLFGFDTNNTMPILFSPNFYDRYHHYFTMETVNLFKRGDIDVTSMANAANGNSAQISDLGITFEKDLYPNQELFEALRQGGYRIVVIPESHGWQVNSMNFDDLYRWRLPDNYLRLDTSGVDLTVQLGDLLYLLDGTPIGLIRGRIERILYEISEVTFVQVDPVDISIFDFEEHEHRMPEWINRNSTNLRHMTNAYTALLSAMAGTGPQFIYLEYNTTHTSRWVRSVNPDQLWYNPNFFGYYMYRHHEIQFQILSTIDMILENDPNAVIVLQSDHGIHSHIYRMRDWGASDELLFNLRTGVFSAVRIPQEYGGLDYALDPRNISRVLVNRFVGQNYELRNDTQDFDILNYWRR